MEGAGTARENEPDPEWGYVGRIPVRNLWLLMLYASDLFRSHHYCPNKVQLINHN